jgi:hypothetical protein
MARSATKKASPSATDKRNTAVLGAFLDRNCRLPAFAQRRLDSLIAKNKIGGGLTSEERRELKEMLDYIDEKTIEMLSYRLVMQKNLGTPPTSRSSRTWKRYIDRRLNEICSR